MTEVPVEVQRLLDKATEEAKPLEDTAAETNTQTGNGRLGFPGFRQGGGCLPRYGRNRPGQARNTPRYRFS